MTPSVTGARFLFNTLVGVALVCEVFVTYLLFAPDLYLLEQHGRIRRDQNAENIYPWRQWNDTTSWSAVVPELEEAAITRSALLLLADCGLTPEYLDHAVMVQAHPKYLEVQLTFYIRDVQTSLNTQGKKLVQPSFRGATEYTPGLSIYEYLPPTGWTQRWGEISDDEAASIEVWRGVAGWQFTAFNTERFYYLMVDRNTGRAAIRGSYTTSVR